MSSKSAQKRRPKMGHILYKQIPITLLGQNWKVDVGQQAICLYKIERSTPTFNQNNNKYFQNLNYLEKHYILLEKFVGSTFKPKYKKDLFIRNSAFIKYIYMVILNKQEWDPNMYLFIEKTDENMTHHQFLKVWAADIGEDF